MGVGRFSKSDRKMMFFGVFSKNLYYGSAAFYYVLSSFPSRTRWHRPFFPIRVYTPSKTRLKVGSVHVTGKYGILWVAPRASVAQRSVWAPCERTLVGSIPDFFWP
jgi:hypothetical protein